MIGQKKKAITMVVTGDKPYRCDKCNETFPDGKQELDREKERQAKAGFQITFIVPKAVIKGTLILH